MSWIYLTMRKADVVFFSSLYKLHQGEQIYQLLLCLLKKTFASRRRKLEKMEQKHT